MSRKNMIVPQRNSYDEDGEVLVPESLRVVLWIARTMGVAPARLRRTRAGWLLSVSSTLAKLQRMIFIFTVILVLTVQVLRIILADTMTQCAQNGACFVKVLVVGGLALRLASYIFGVWAASRKLQALKSLIQQTQKIKNSIGSDASKIKYTGSINKMFIVYVIWHISTMAEDLFSWIDHVGEQRGNVLMVVSIGLSAVIYYQDTMAMIVRMMISAMIMELKLTLTLLNDKLEDLLQTPSMPSREIKLKLYLRELPQRAKVSGNSSKDTGHLDEDLGSIRHINRCHEMICDMVAQVDKMHGPFLLIFFIVLLVELLITLQVLIAGLGSSIADLIVRQTNRTLMLFLDLLVLVEPCQRLQDQMDRTRCLLGRLLGQAQRCGIDPAQLDLFILQAQIRDVEVTAMGVITVRRPIVASIIGIVFAYLIIMVQNENASVSLDS